MVADQLFYKKRLKKEREFKRRKASRTPKEVVLIVCEGKTEREYFKYIKNILRLNIMNIEVAEEPHGSDPLSVVNYAIKKLKKDPDYDFVYCVLDRDKHKTFDAAMDRARHKKKIIPIVSVPCFEFWILLHFEKTTRSFCTAGDESNCNKVIHDLHKYIPDYQKGRKDIYESLWEKRTEAIKWAKQIKEYHMTSGSDNPSTMMYKVVEKLEFIADGSRQ